MGWFYNDPKLMVMNKTRWLFLYKAIQDREVQRFKLYFQNLSFLFKQMLGLEVKENEMIPLSAFINPEMFKKLFTQEEKTLDEDETIWVIEGMNDGRE